jgi:DNA-binding LacI/PurR family transcriptional regulator
VRQPAEAMGRRAMELLLRRVAEPTTAFELVALQPELVVRRSCGVGFAAVTAAART